MEQDIALRARGGITVEAHDKTEAVVGVPYTMKVGAPPKMTTPPTLTVMEKANVFVFGTAEKVNSEPSVDVDGVMLPAVADETTKSDAKPVVEPDTPRTAITPSGTE
jgi:hypothetical protein